MTENKKRKIGKCNQNGGNQRRKTGSVCGRWKMGVVDEVGEVFGATGADAVGEVGTRVNEGSWHYRCTRIC